jgi:hypothetical protein
MVAGGVLPYAAMMIKMLSSAGEPDGWHHVFTYVQWYAFVLTGFVAGVCATISLSLRDHALKLLDQLED